MHPGEDYFELERRAWRQAREAERKKDSNEVKGILWGGAIIIVAALLGIGSIVAPLVILIYLVYMFSNGRKR